MGQRKVMQGLLPRIAVGVFGLLTVATVLLAIFDDRGVLQVRKQHEKLSALNSEITAISEGNEKLRKEIYQLRHDPATIERKAREDLKFVKPGEIILVVPETPKN